MRVWTSQNTFKSDVKLGALMAEAFDPYEKWLGIPKEKRPLTSYRLLGVDLFEPDVDRIQRRAERRIELMERLQSGKHAPTAKKVLKQLLEARDCLLDPAKKQKYDKMLRQKLDPSELPPAPPAPVEVDEEYHDSEMTTDNLSLFDFANTPLASAAAANGGFPNFAAPANQQPSYSGYDPNFEPKGKLKQNFWVIPVAIGCAGLFILIGAMMLIGGDDAPTVPIAKGPDDKTNTPTTPETTPPKGIDDILGTNTPPTVDPNVPTTIPNTPTTTTPPTSASPEELLIGHWKSMAFEGDSDFAKTLKEAVYTFEKDGTYQHSLTLISTSRPIKDEGKFEVAGETLTLKSKDNLEDKLTFSLSGKLLVVTNSDGKLKTTLMRAAPPTGNTDPDPTPVAVDNEPETVLWAGAPDAFLDGDLSPLPADRVAAIKPAFPIATFAFNPSQTIAAVGAKKGGQVEVWDIAAGNKKSAINVGQEQVLAVAVPNQQKVWVWSSDSGLQVYNAADGTPDRKLTIPVQDPLARPDMGMVVSPGGKFLALCRKGIRVYRTDTYALVGLLPPRKDEFPLAFGFNPDGAELVVIYQSTGAPALYRILPYDLSNGNADEELAKLRPGLIDDYAGRISYSRGEMNRLYLTLGDHYIIYGNEGHLVWTNKTPHPLAIPLEGGQFLVADAKGSVSTKKTNWEKLESAVKNMDLSRVPAAISPNDPNVPIAVEVTAKGVVNSDSLAKQRLEATISARLRAQGFVVDPMAKAKLIVTYTEQKGGTATKLNYYDEHNQPLARNYETPFATASATGRISWKTSQFDWFQEYIVEDNYNTADQLLGNTSGDKIFAVGLLESAARQLTGMIIPIYRGEDALEGSIELPVKVSRLE